MMGWIVGTFALLIGMWLAANRGPATVPLAIGASILAVKIFT
jgi:hypothetical protein